MIKFIGFVIPFLVVVIILGLAILKIVKDKKKGKKCLGCPLEEVCSKNPDKVADEMRRLIKKN